MASNSCHSHDKARQWVYRVVIGIMLLGGVFQAGSLNKAWKAEELVSQRYTAAITDSAQCLWSWPVPAGEEADWPYSEIWTGPNFPRILKREDQPTIDQLGEFIEMLHPDDREAMQRALRDSAIRTKRFTLDFQIRNGEGEFIWVRGRGGVSIVGGNLTVSGSLVDITREKRERLRAEMIVKSAQLAIVMCDENRRVTVFNDRAVQLFGLPPEKILGGLTDWLIETEDRPYHIKAYAAAATRLRAKPGDTYYTINGLKSTALGVKGPFPVRLNIRGLKYRDKIEFVAAIYPEAEAPQIPEDKEPDIKPLKLEPNEVEPPQLDEEPPRTTE